MLNRPQDRVHDQHRNDNNGTFHVAGDHGNHRGNQKDNHQKIFKLFRKHLQSAFLLPFLESILAVLLQTMLRFLTGQTLFFAVHLLKNRSRIHLIPILHVSSSFS